MAAALSGSHLLPPVPAACFLNDIPREGDAPLPAAGCGGPPAVSRGIGQSAEVLGPASPKRAGGSSPGLTRSRRCPPPPGAPHRPPPATGPEPVAGERGR